MQAVGRAEALLEGMQIFQLCSALLGAKQHEAAVKVVLCIFTVAQMLGPAFLR